MSARLDKQEQRQNERRVREEQAARDLSNYRAALTSIADYPGPLTVEDCKRVCRQALGREAFDPGTDISIQDLLASEESGDGRPGSSA